MGYLSDGSNPYFAILNEIRTHASSCKESCAEERTTAHGKYCYFKFLSFPQNCRDVDRRFDIHVICQIGLNLLEERQAQLRNGIGWESQRSRKTCIDDALNGNIGQTWQSKGDIYTCLKLSDVSLYHSAVLTREPPTA